MMSESDVSSTTGGLRSPASTTPDVPGPDAGATQQDASAAQRAAHAGAEAGQHLAHEAKDRAGEVLGESKKQARNLVDRTRSELTEQAGTQQKRVAEGLRSLSAELEQMSRSSEDPSYATELVQRAASTSGDVATWFDERDPGALLEEIKGFARRRPGVFLAVAAGAGLLVGRLARSMKDAPDDASTDRSASTESEAPDVGRS